MRKYRFVLSPDKYNKYEELSNYLDTRDNISLFNKKDMEAWQYVNYIKDLKGKSEDKWIKNHHKELYYIREMKDVGYAFVDIVEIFTLKTGEKLFQFSFLNDLECDKFLKKVRLN